MYGERGFVIRRYVDLQERARLGEGEPRQARIQLARIAVPEIAEEFAG
jgi:hypothetical protein